MKIKRIVVIIVCVLVASFSIGTLIAPKKEYSENENRHLTIFPAFSTQSFFEGEYIEAVENFLTDHFLLRDSFMNLYASVLKAEGKTEINNVYLGSEGYLIEKTDDYKNLDKIIDKVNTLGNKLEANIWLMLVPTSVTVYSDKLPQNAVCASEIAAINTIYNQVSSNINCIDVTEALLENKDKYNLYYKTDHHWTTYGAYVAYVEYCKKVGLNSFDIGEYNIKEISKTFYGTVFSKVNDTTVMPDSMHVFNKARDLSITYQKEISNSLYKQEYLQKKDKYSYFLNNINDVITIENNQIKNADASPYKGKVLLVVKDSYANCFIPFLTDYYEKIVVLDTRYYMYGVSALASNIGASDVLVLYNMGTIDTDTGINGIY